MSERQRPPRNCRRGSPSRKGSIKEAAELAKREAQLAEKWLMTEMIAAGLHGFANEAQAREFIKSRLLAFYKLKLGAVSATIGWRTSSASHLVSRYPGGTPRSLHRPRTGSPLRRHPPDARDTTGDDLENAGWGNRPFHRRSRNRDDVRPDRRRGARRGSGGHPGRASHLRRVRRQRALERRRPLERLRAIFAAALLSAHDPQALEVLEHALDADDSRLRSAAIFASGYSGSRASSSPAATRGERTERARTGKRPKPRSACSKSRTSELAGSLSGASSADGASHTKKEDLPLRAASASLGHVPVSIAGATPRREALFKRFPF